MIKTDKPYRGKANLNILFGENTSPPNTINEDTSPPNTINIDTIFLPPAQPRKYFDPDKLEQLKESIKQHGILEPLLVRPLTEQEGKYELVAGERRLRASQSLGLTDIPVVIRELTDENALQIALIENLQRDDLNPVEETEGILQLLSIELNQSVEQVISLLYRMHNEAKGKVTQNVLGNEQTEQIKSVFNSLGLINWESFVTTRLPLLKLPADILIILQEGRIAYTKAIALSKIKEEKIRLDLLTETIDNNLSLREIKERIKQIKSDIESPELPSANLKNLIKNIDKVKLWETDPKKWKKVQSLMDKIQLLLDD